MSEHKHTPGQWVAKPDIVDNDGSWEVHEMLDPARYAPTQYVLIAYGLTEETARLIAAAPDMLAALKAVEEWWLSEGVANFSGAPYAIFAARAAIAKATTPSPNAAGR